MGRVHWGKGMGWIYPTLAIPVPSGGVGGLPAKLMPGFPLEFKLRLTVISLSTTPITSLWAQRMQQDVLKDK